MNEIIIKDNKIEKNIDKNINVTYNLKDSEYDVVKIKIDVLKDNDLRIVYEDIDKIDIEINISENVLFNLYEYRKTDKLKIQNKYYLEADSNVVINKFNDSNELKELDITYLNGQNATINYNLNTISKGKQRVDIIAYHNSSNTNSYINNKSVTIDDGSIVFNVTGNVYNNIVDCNVHQDSKIINLNDAKCEINPILLIDENDVEAEHAAYIGKFKESDIFYLMSRGIPYDKAINLLVRGFLYIDIKDDDVINNTIDKYWR